MPAPSIKRLAMICPTLVDQGGHEYDYTSMIASAALKKGIEPLTIIPKHSTDQIRLPGDTIRLLPDFSPSKTPLAFLYGALRRGLSYIRAFLRVGSPGTLWFVHSGSRYEMALLSIVWMILPHKEQKLVLFLRKEIEYSKRLLTSILRFASQNGVIFVSDGDELAEYMTKSLRSEVKLLPVPIRPSQNTRRADTPVRCGYFGAKRLAKGFQKLPILIEALRSVAPSVEFVIQAYKHRDDRPDEALDRLVREFEQASDIRLIDETVDTVRFADELAACSIVLLPYKTDVYKKATSGIFVMAVAADAVVVATEGTWMAAQAKKYGLSRVVLLPEEPTQEQTMAAMRSAVSLLKNAPLVGDDERNWRASQSAENIVTILSATFAERGKPSSSSTSCLTR